MVILSGTNKAHITSANLYPRLTLEIKGYLSPCTNFHIILRKGTFLSSSLPFFLSTYMRTSYANLIDSSDFNWQQLLFTNAFRDVIMGKTIKRCFAMLLVSEKAKEKILMVYSLPDDCFNIEMNDFVKERIADCVNRGYDIYSIIYTTDRPPTPELQKVYNAAYSSKATMDRLITLVQDDILRDTVYQVVKEQLSKFNMEDLIDLLKDD